MVMFMVTSVCNHDNFERFYLEIFIFGVRVHL